MDDDDRRRFVCQLANNVQTHAVILYAFVLMDNHFHLLVRTPRANLSQFMQRLNTSYALYARYKHDKPGHQLQSRFHAKLVQDEGYLLAVTRYVHLNPIKVMKCGRLSSPERAKQLESYPWSSYPGYVAKRKAQEFVCYDVLREYGSTLAAARHQYRVYVLRCVTEDDQLLFGAMRASRYAIGADSFVEETKRRLENLRTGKVQDKDVSLPSLTIEIDKVDAYVAADYRIAAADLKEHGNRSGPAKDVAVELACRLTGLSGRAVGMHYGGISAAAVSNIRRKVREGPADLLIAVDRVMERIHEGTI